ncbi:MAG: endonuclease III [Acholeplasmataceae bacterium]|nr:endonuclease III [Acholeplasmataceae bacterium]
MKHLPFILKTLDEMYPNATVELDHRNNFELLISVVLSAQTTDIAVNKITPALFNKYPTPELLAKAKEEDVITYIRTIGLFRNKAKNIIALSKQLIDKHHGQVPSTREDLEALPGVGRKTANVVLSNAFGIPALAVDTHVARVSVRLGFAKPGDSVLTIEKKLMEQIPEEYWQKVHHQFIHFGRYHCLARNPKCYSCPFYDICTFEKKSLFRNKVND